MSPQPTVATVHPTQIIGRYEAVRVITIPDMMQAPVMPS